MLLPAEKALIASPNESHSMKNAPYWNPPPPNHPTFGEMMEEQTLACEIIATHLIEDAPTKSEEPSNDPSVPPE